MSEHYQKLQRYYLDQPNEISLETIALCNAACTFCPYPTLERKGEKMTDQLIDKVITEMATFTTPFMFSPFKVNEPLLDKRLFDICERVASETVAQIRIFTNGAALTKKKIERIAGLQKIRHLWVSLNEHRPKQYKRLMNMDFNHTARRLDTLHEIVLAGRFPHDVVLSTVGFPNEPFRKYCFERWPQFECYAIQKSGWLGYTDPQVDVVPDTPCSRWFELSIMSSGVVSLCCMDGEGQFPIGDLNEQTLLEVYNSPGWRERRLQLSSRREHIACETCTY
jgi:hypothetical protein